MSEIVRAFDIVRTPSGNMGMVTKTVNTGKMASIFFFGEWPKKRIALYECSEKMAWWDCSELIVVDSFLHIMAHAMDEPANQISDAAYFFGQNKREDNV
jgi:hypothetical protein